MPSRPLLSAAGFVAGLHAASAAQAQLVPVEVCHAAPGALPSSNRIDVTVEVCDALGACVQVPDMIVDTVSAGLRPNRAAFGALQLPAVAGRESDAPLHACARLAQGNIWGEVVEARVRLGGLASAWLIPIRTYTRVGPGGAGHADGIGLPSPEHPRGSVLY